MKENMLATLILNVAIDLHCEVGPGLCLNGVEEALCEWAHGQGLEHSSVHLWAAENSAKLKKAIDPAWECGNVIPLVSKAALQRSLSE
jgi:hypothetical protein